MSKGEAGVFEKSIRQQVMNGNGETIRSLLLTSDQVNLVKLITDQKTITTEELSGMLNISTPNASAKLNRLYRSGYLGRVGRSAESGGIEYQYQIC